MTDQEQTHEIIVPRGGAIAETVGAEIDQQVMTAKQFPRSVSRSLSEMQSLITQNKAIANECRYALMRQSKIIEGPSSRFAEIVASCWQNNRNGARVVDIDRKHVTCQGYFIDLEQNMATAIDVKRSIVGKSGRTYNADMITVTAQAALSIAHRNAVLKGVPKALWLPAYETAIRMIEGDEKSLEERRNAMLETLTGQGVSKERIFAVVGAEGIEDITLKRLAFIRGLYQAIKDGEASIDDQFPEIGNARTAKKRTVLDDLAGSQKPADEPTAKPEPEPQAADQAEIERELTERIDNATAEQLPDIAGDIVNSGVDKETFERLMLLAEKREADLHGAGEEK